MVQFMELIISGQDKIRHFWRCQQEIIRRKDKSEQILGQNIFDAETNLGQFTIQAFEENGKEILIQSKLYLKTRMFFCLIDRVIFL